MRKGSRKTTSLRYFLVTLLLGDIHFEYMKLTQPKLLAKENAITKIIVTEPIFSPQEWVPTLFEKCGLAYDEVSYQLGVG